MDLWWKAAGSVRMRLTSGDAAGRLRMLTQREIRLEDLEFESDLTVCFTVSRKDAANVRSALVGRGDLLETLAHSGGTARLRAWARYPVLCAVLALLAAATMWVPSRILFIQVQGNGDIPQRLILEAAGECGLSFGASRRELRSEQVKNYLLKAIPQLSWAGVNTSGCVATITVAVRSEEEAQSESYAGSIIAARDALVTQITATGGTALCAVGDSVQAGDVLISGYTDLGICTRAQSAQGEVYGITRREVSAVLPLTTVKSTSTGEIVKKYSVLIGKKRINLYSDSGISHTTCGKIREVKWLTLPGGWILPAALVVESYTVTEWSPADRQDAESCLAQAVRDQVRRTIIAGEILTQSVTTLEEENVWRLSGVYECREMIGRKSQGVYLEGDTYDNRENAERGAG